MEAAPLIITLKLDEATHKYFTTLRNLYFPKHCNFLEAHLTLFHALPSDIECINETLKESCGHSIFQLEVSEVKNIGNGVAYSIKCPALQEIHRSLQEAFKPYLVLQDRQKLWPHITVQNKVTAFKAKQTTELLQVNFTPFNIKAIGFSTWLYAGGPWMRKDEFLFRQEQQDASRVK